jgi:hypothetical protein
MGVISPIFEIMGAVKVELKTQEYENLEWGRERGIR